VPVFVSLDGQLGIQVSSERFKDDIKPTAEAGEVLFALKPLTSHYKKVLDPTNHRAVWLGKVAGRSRVGIRPAV
jgi:hypothetical protein